MDAIKFLRNEGGIETTQEAFDMVKELNKEEAIGVSQFGLTPEQVQLTPNFGYHTLNAIRILKNDGIEDTQVAFKMVKGLNEDEVRGISQFQLDRDQVEGLNLDQIRGLTYFKLSREQIEDPSYNKEILETMLSLRIFIPEAEGLHLYETAMQMEYYQKRGILKHGLSLDQVGMGISEGRFTQKNTRNIPLKELIEDLQSTLIGRNFKLTKKQEDKALNLLDKILQDIRENKISLMNARPRSPLDSLGTPPNKNDSKKTPKKRRRNKGYKNNSKEGRKKRKP